MPASHLEERFIHFCAKKYRILLFFRPKLFQDLLFLSLFPLSWGCQAQISISLGSRIRSPQGQCGFLARALGTAHPIAQSRSAARGSEISPLSQSPLLNLLGCQTRFTVTPHPEDSCVTLMARMTVSIRSVAGSRVHRGKWAKLSHRLWYVPPQMIPCLV